MDRTPLKALLSLLLPGDQPESARKKRLSLQGYLSVTLGVLIFALSFMLAGILEGFARREVLRLAEQNLETVSRQMARELATGMHGFGRDVQALASTDVFQDPGASASALRPILDRFSQQHPEFVFIGVIDMATDQVFASNGGLFEGGNIKGRPAYENAKTGPYLGDVHPAVRLAELLPKPADGDPLRFFDASAPVMDKSGKTFRVLAGHISTQWATQVRQLVLSPLAKDQQIELVMVDTAGKVVLSPNASIRAGTPINTLIGDATAARATVQRWSNAQDYLTVSAPVQPHGAFNGFGWRVMARQPTDVAFAPANMLRNAVFAGAFVLASIAAWLAWLMAGRITRPVRELAASAESISSTRPTKVALDTRISEVASVHDALARLAIEGEQFARSNDEQQRQFVMLSDCLPHLVFQADSDGNIQYMNDQWLTELDVASSISLNDMSYHIHPEDNPIFASLWQSSRTSGADLTATVRMAKPESKDFEWFKVRGKAVRDAQGQVSRWVGTFTNIHQSVIDAERVAIALSSEREARSAIERVSQMKDDFLATLSHELRTPLNVIGGWAQMLESQAKGDEFVAHAGAVIRRNVDLQAQLICDLLDMSAIVAGKVILVPRPDDAVQLVEGVVQSMSKGAQDKGVEIEAAMPATVTIFVDPVRLSQVLSNLLSNAIKFTDRGGRISIAGRLAGDALELKVSDTGSGISADFLPHVFDRFRQEDSSCTRKRGGVGLGLAISKSLVELHEGTITAHSEGLGKGCVMTITLPLMPSRFDLSEAGVPSESASHPSRTVDGTSILLIDDDDDAREMAKEMLMRFGACVVSAASASEGLGQLNQASFDVVLCDISMPGMDGYECVREIRSHADRVIASVPAIALTAFAMKQDQAAAMEAGFDSHVAKPFAANDLLTAISKVMAMKNPAGVGRSRQRVMSH